MMADPIHGFGDNGSEAAVSPSKIEEDGAATRVEGKDIRSNELSKINYARGRECFDALSR